MSKYLKNGKVLVFMLGILLFGNNPFAQTQLPECTVDVPFFNLDLSASPDLTFTTPEFIRKTGCCGDGDNYVSFYVILHPDVAMFELVVAPGYADPPGSGNYNIISGGDLNTPGACGTQIPGGVPICISGSGPHKIIYSKPGGNKIKYIFRQIPRPIFPADNATRIGCSLPLSIYGLNNISLTSINSSTGNVTPGAYNSLLSCTNCTNPSFSPGLGTPTWIDYQICGTPQAAVCGSYASCDTVRLYTYNSLNISSLPNPATFCSDGPGVLLTASAIGGDGNYSYTWVNSLTDTVSILNTYTASIAGSYTAQVEDGLSSPTCPAAYVSVPVIVSDPPIVDAGLDQTVCATSPLAFLSGTVNNATGVVWTGGTGTFNPNNTSLLTAYTPSWAEINAGSVTLTLVSTGAGGGCSEDSNDVTITFSDTVYANPYADPISCNGGSASIYANGTGGIGSYSYLWSTGASTSSIISSAGTYTVYIFDQIGCLGIGSTSVNQPSPLILTMSSTNESIDGACDGSASVSISGGSAPYSVLWSNAQTTTTTTSTLCYGTYTVTVTDNNGCVVIASVVVNNFTCSTFDVSASGTDVDCYNGTNGTAQAIIVSGGNSPFTYSWNTTPPQNTQTATNLGAGAYTVLVTDNLGCYDIAGITILQPTIITNTMTHTDVTTIGGSDGTATANAFGGTPGYTYLWAPGAQTTQTATNLSSAVGGVTYYVNITDSKLCVKSDSVHINQPPCNNFDLGINSSNVSCNGLSNGSANLVILDGTPPYSIVWSHGPVNITSVSGLAAGNYSVTVTDLSNCTTFKSFTITQPDPITLALVPTNITCFGEADGTIDLTVAGGTYPFSYVWMMGGKNVANYEDLVSLVPGTYSVTVTDANGCTAVGSVGITQPTALGATYTYVDNGCYGYANGSVNLTPTGGLSPYAYNWTGPGSFSASTQDLSGLISGLYKLNMTDLNGCAFGPLQVYINQPDSLIATATMSQEVSCASGNDGAISLLVSGGTLNYSYAWTGPSAFAATTQNISGLAAGTYTITVTDGQGCTATDSELVITALDTINPVISCTGNKAVNTSSSNCIYTQTGTSWNATATDDCLVSSIIYNLTGATIGTGSNLNGVAFNLGVTTVTWVATDGIGNMDTCFYTVTVTDITVPTITSCGATGNQTTNMDAGQCNYTVSGTAWNATATDNCSVSTILATLSGATIASGLTTLAGVDFNLGTTTVVWTVTDGSGNISTCTFNVLVVDNILPAISSCGASGNQTVNVDAGQCNHTHIGTSWNATATDNCTMSTVLATLSGATTASGLTTLAGVDFNLGTTTVVWTVTDGSGNISTCTFNVLVVDNVLPAISSCGASSNQTVNVDAGQCNHTHIGTGWNATATDNCTMSTILASLSGATTATGLTTLAGVDFNLGTTTVLWTVTDASGNISTCTFNVLVVDNVLPAISSCGASGNQTVNVDAGQCNHTHVGTGWNATATDNCTMSTVLATLTGATTASGLTTLAGVDFNLGTTTVVWTVTDGSGNISTCTFNVLVVDNVLPIITSCGASGNQTVNVDAGQCNYTVSGTAWNATATDNCSVNTILATLSGATTASGLTTLAGVDFNLGTTTVVWVITDISGNISTCTFNVLVVDNILPAVTTCGAAGNQTVNVDAGQCNYTVIGTGWNATSTDNCTVSIILATLSGATTASGLTTLAGVDFNLGTTTVVWTVTDGSGNISTCAFNVLVVDNIQPTILSCGATGNQTVNANTGLCTYTHPNNTWNASATDNCSVVSITYNLTGATSGSGTTLSGQVFNLGVTTVTWTATDGVSNTTTCSFTVTVNDVQLPIITSCGAVGNQTVIVDAGQCNFTQTGTAWNASASDNCSIATLVYTLSGATTGTGTSLQNVDFNLGTTTVIWTAMDGSGNISTCTFQVLVVDNQLPAISSCGATGNQIVSSNSGLCTFIQTTNAWDATATDNCTVSSLTYTLTGATTGAGTTLNGVVFNPGTTTVTWTVVDNSLNAANCSFTVTINDSEFPVLSACPTNISIGSDNGDCGALVSWTVPTFTDNCGATMTSTHNSGDFFAIGTTTVTYSVTDGAGNTSICTFSVTVNDDENPGITCPTPIASCDPLVNYSVPVTSDNCGVLSMIQIAGLSSGSSFPVGVTSNTYQVTDIHSNVSTCSFTVTIHPTPILALAATDVTCNGNNDGSIDLTVTNGTTPYDYTWSNSAITEDISGLAPGTYSVTVTDALFCSATSSTSILEPNDLVLTAEEDEVNCFNGNDGGVDIDIAGGTTPYSYSWSNGQTSQDVIGLPSDTYGVTVTDANGCIVSYVATITQPDSLIIQAVINDATCDATNGSIQAQVTGGTEPYSYLWSNGSIGLNLNNVVAGTYTLTVTDIQNCTAVYTGTIESVTNLNAQLDIRNVSCYNESNGEAQVIVLNGNSPYTYEWSNGDSTFEVDSLAAGSYSVEITDVFGCNIILNFDIFQPDSIYVELITSIYTGGYNVSTYNGNNGYISSQVFGGNSPYNYIWSTGDTTQSVSNLSASVCSVLVTDENGCVAYATSRLTQPSILEMPSGYSPNSDGDNDYFVVHGIDAYPNNEIVIYNRWGNIVYKKANYANEWNGGNTSGESLPDATYFVILTVFADENIVLKGYVDLRR